jgi:Na+/H+ antiporter NhaD/arsenite permease-like protein
MIVPSTTRCIGQAYIAIALDATGLLRFLAFWVVRKGGSSGHRLYLFLYIFFFGFGVLVGNVSNLSLVLTRL